MKGKVHPIVRDLLADGRDFVHTQKHLNTTVYCFVIGTLKIS